MELKRFGARVFGGVFAAVLATGMLVVVFGGWSNASAAARRTVEHEKKGGPITIGFLNEQQGTVAFPTFGAGAQAARIYINHHGGIDGHQLKFLDCYTDGSPTSAVACADRFVQARVSAVLEGISEGSDAAVPILAGAGIPLVGHTAFGTVQANSTDAFFFGAATGAYDVVPLEVMKRDLHLGSVTYVAATNPPDRGFVTDDSEPAAKALGLKYQAIYYNVTSPNYQSAAESAIATGAKAIFFTATTTACTSLVSALRTLSYSGAIVAGSCSAFITADAAQANGVFTATDLYVPDDTTGVPARDKAESKTYVKAMNSYAPKYTQGFAQDTFSSTMDLATALRKIHGKVDSASVLNVLRHIRDQESYMGQRLDCNGKQWPDERAVCAGGLLEYQVKHGTRVVYTKGFVDGESLVK